MPCLQNCRLHVVHYHLYGTTRSGPPPTTRTQLLRFKTCGFADHLRETCIQGLQNDFANLEPSQTEPDVGGNGVLFFNEKVIFVRKPIVLIGDVFAMAPYHSTTEVHSL